MKIFKLSIFFILFCAQWDMHAQELSVINGFTAPSAISSHGNNYYISNLGNGKMPGYISRANREMEIIDHKFIDNLQAPRGMAFFKDNLYVCDAGKVIGFNIQTGKQAVVYDLSASGAKTLSAIAIIDNRKFLVASKDLNTIFNLDPKTGEYTPLVQVASPIDICLDELKQQLYVASAGKEGKGDGKLGVINLKNKKSYNYSTLSDYTGYINGFYIYSNLLYFTDWKQPANKSAGELKSLNLSTKDIKTLSTGLRLNRPGAMLYDYRMHTFYVTNQADNALYKIVIHD